MVIDEIQRAPESLLAIKAQVDADQRPGRYLLTGSSRLQTDRLSTMRPASHVRTMPLA
ncbi:AAA family ATPase [Nonomuraea sp. CA-218870]|uniref:AAA family ATPase n=1 Tax=Nonomuraea sp. CA-218870 TaxID=3239998 RepID=UPI003D9347D4